MESWKISEEMAEGVILRPDQLANKNEGELVESQAQKKAEDKIVKNVDVDLEAPVAGEAGSPGSADDDGGKWSTATALATFFKVLYIPLGLLTLLLLATNFYLNFPFALAIALASIVGLQQPGCLNLVRFPNSLGNLHWDQRRQNFRRRWFSTNAKL